MKLTDDQLKIVQAIDGTRIDWPPYIGSAQFSVEVNNHPFQWIIELHSSSDESGISHLLTVFDIDHPRPERDCPVSTEQFLSATTRSNKLARLAAAKRNLSSEISKVLPNAGKIENAFIKLGKAARKLGGKK